MATNLDEVVVESAPRPIGRNRITIAPHDKYHSGPITRPGKCPLRYVVAYVSLLVQPAQLGLSFQTIAGFAKSFPMVSKATADPTAL